MKYNLHINQPQALELGIKNVNQAHVFDLLTTCSIWAETVIVDKKVFYFVARQKICSELPLLDMKPDTAYRHLKALEKLNLIKYEKVGKLDCIQITKKGKKYHSQTMSEINPKKLGNKSESHSEINPTYNTTILYPTTKDTHKGISPRQIIEFYYKNISSKNEKVKEQKSFNALGLLPKEDNLQMVLTGLRNYSNVLPADERYIKSLFNFIQNREYRDFQEAVELSIPKGNSSTSGTADLIKAMYSQKNNTEPYEEAEVIEHER